MVEAWSYSRAENQSISALQQWSICICLICHQHRPVPSFLRWHNRQNNQRIVFVIHPFDVVKGLFHDEDKFPLINAAFGNCIYLECFYWIIIIVCCTTSSCHLCSRVDDMGEIVKTRPSYGDENTVNQCWPGVTHFRRQIVRLCHIYRFRSLFAFTIVQKKYACKVCQLCI